MNWKLLPLLFIAFASACNTTHAEPAFGQGIMVGEVTDTSAIVQVRVTDGTELIDGDIYDDGDPLRDGDLPGTQAKVVFLLSDNDAEAYWKQVGSVDADADNDFIARLTLDDLKPGTDYKVMAIAMLAERQDEPFADVTIGRFKTHPGKDTSAPVRFVLSSCMNYDKFIGNDTRGIRTGGPYDGDDRALGYPAAEAVLEQKPDFVIYAGDVVYYKKTPPVKTLEDMRAKWHRQNHLPRMRALHAAAPGYWMKDDWDYRANDSDPTRDYFPSHELGINTFREQVPIVPPGDDESPTYRTHRVSKDLQVWFVEGRDYRDANRQEDGPDKSVWGQKQVAWLKKTLVESDATYKLIISPTPLVGPDDGYKNDNHTNPKGFATEGEAFKQWGKEHGLWDNTFLMCGDRHWQYHSIDPTGATEFSCGAFNDENSRMGRKPGDKGSTDPEALITQPFTSPRPSGGFLTVSITPEQGDEKPLIEFEFFDDLGDELYSYTPDAD